MTNAFQENAFQIDAFQIIQESTETSVLIQQILDYYVNLLIIQYNQKPKARATIEAVIREMLAEGVLFDIQNGFDIETAVGSQLDILGKYIGIDRFYLATEFTDNYFGFADATDLGGTSANIVGFDDATAPDKEGLFLSATDVVAAQFRLNDEAYRFLLKLKIVQNYSNHSASSIDDAMAFFFPDQIIFKDNYDMTITYFVFDLSSNLIKAALNKQVFPKPMGVGLQAIVGQDYFGFTDATAGNIPSYLVGFNDATAPDKEGFFFNTNSDIITT